MKTNIKIINLSILLQLPEIVKESTLSIMEVDAYSGTYFADNGMKLEILSSRNQLYAKLANNPPLRIVLESHNIFKAVKIDITLEFTRSGNERNVVGIIAKDRGEIHNFKKQ